MDPVLLLLFAGMVLFTAMLIIVDKAFPNDGQTFQVISGLLTGFSGAFFGRLVPQKEHPGETESRTTTTSETPK